MLLEASNASRIRRNTILACQQKAVSLICLDFSGVSADSCIVLVFGLAPPPRRFFVSERNVLKQRNDFLVLLVLFGRHVQKFGAFPLELGLHTWVAVLLGANWADNVI